jgi:NAD(P)-dependent dehydrogenase (short-subunit alcohol dehydrogenase family)
MATPEGKTKDGFETQFGTNHLSHFLLFQLLKPILLASSSSSFHSRVISVASTGHRVSPIRFEDINFEKEQYNPWLAYGQSKTANVYLANEIERRYGKEGLHGLSLHPGGIATGLGKHVAEEDQKAQGWDSPEVRKLLRSAEQGAATTVYAAISKEWEGRGGRYLSNCIEQGPQEVDVAIGLGGGDGYSAWAYDEDASRRLWTESLKMVGLEDDQD